MPQKRRNIQVRGQRREKPDMRRLARAVILFAQAAAERDAQAQAQAERNRSTSPPQRRPS